MHARTMFLIVMSLGLGSLGSLTSAGPDLHFGRGYQQPDMMDLFLKAFEAIQKNKDLESNKAILAEFSAILGQCHDYDLKAQPHPTDGWSDFMQAEWPFMTLVYTGFSLCRLPELFPENRAYAVKEVRWLLQALQTHAVSGFMEPHFGTPFPKDGLPQKMSVFVHGHFMALALLARKNLGITDFDEVIHRLYRGFIRDYTKASLLPSYRGMYYVCDNGSALASLALYDRMFGGHGSALIRARAISDTRQYYLEKESALVCTYIDAEKKTQASSPRGTGTMYLNIFLPDIDAEFAAEQWQQSKTYLLKPLNSVLSEENLGIPDWILSWFKDLLPDSQVCLEHPAISSSQWLSRQWGDADSGPVVLGVGTSASGFLIASAVANGDLKVARSTLNLANHMGGYTWQDNKLFATNSFHAVGQVIVLYGKILCLIEEKKLSSPPSAD